MNQLVYLFTSSLSDGSIHRANRIQTLNFSYALGAILGRNLKLITFGGYGDERLKKLGLGGKREFHKEFTVKLNHFRTLYFLYRIVFFSLLKKEDVIYCRDIHLAKGMSYLKKAGIIKNDIYFEVHEIFNDSRLVSFINLLTGVVAISGAIKKELKARGVTVPILGVHDGVNMENFRKIKQGKAELRQKFGLGVDDFLIVYTGNLYRGRGIEIIVEMAYRLEDVVFVIAGGTEDDIRRYKTLAEKRGIQNITFKGYLPYSEIPCLLKASDLLVMPYTKGTRTYKYMSPLKLFEYMASNVPILSSDIGTVKEVLSEDICYFFNPENVGSAIDKVREIKAEYSVAIKKAEKAFKKVESTYSWEKRADRVISFVEMNSGDFGKRLDA